MLSRVFCSTYIFGIKIFVVVRVSLYFNFQFTSATARLQTVVPVNPSLLPSPAIHHTVSVLSLKHFVNNVSAGRPHSGRSIPKGSKRLPETALRATRHSGPRPLARPAETRRRGGNLIPYVPAGCYRPLRVTKLGPSACACPCESICPSHQIYSDWFRGAHVSRRQ